MKKHRFVITLEGPVTVAFSKAQNLHICNALEFDIVGTGDTADQALAQVKELVEDYIETVVTLTANGKKVNFYNPAIQEMWNKSKEKKRFYVQFIIGLVKDISPAQQLGDIDDLSEYSDSIEAINLVPA